MKRYFFSGLALLLPFTMTLIIVSFVINLLTTPFEEFVETTLDYYNILDQPVLFLSGQQVLFISSKLLILIVLFGLVLLIGYFARLVLLNMIIDFGEKVIQRIPMINVIYKSVKEIVNSLFSSRSKAFTDVVLIPYPNPDTLSIGLIAASQNNPHDASSVSVFMPTAFNLTVGFMLMVPKEELIFIDMKVEDALKCVISGGITFPDFQTVKK